MRAKYLRLFAYFRVVQQGNTALAVPIVMTLLLPAVYLYLQKSSDIPTKKEYEDEELQDAASALALMILRIRDGKTRDTLTNGVLRNLTKELIASAKAEGGYPDSDDEDEEDEDDDERRGGKEPSNDTGHGGRRRGTGVFVK